MIRQFNKVFMYDNSNNRKKRIGHIIINYPLTIKDLIQIVKEYKTEDYHAIMDALEELKVRLGKKNAEKHN